MAPPWQVVGDLGAVVEAEVGALLAAVAATHGEEPFSEAQTDRKDEVRHALLRDPSGRLVGYGILAGRDPVEAEAAYGTFDDGFASMLESRAEPTSLVLRDVGDPVIDVLLARGWRRSRRILRLARPLPAPAPPDLGPGVDVRAFRVGVDEAAWVDQNNASFAGHPVQSTMSVERVARREAATWFDPGGFLLFWEGEALVASCWTKLRRSRDELVGEIYVISVAPGAQGRGLGRAAVLSGLASLAARGAVRAELYVEAANLPAIALYESLGFGPDATVVELHFAVRT